MPSILIACLASVITLAAGLLTLKFEAQRAVIFAFCAGVLVAGALLNVIPDALVLLESTPSPLHHHHLLLSCIGGFLCFYFFEYAAPHPHSQDDQAHYRHRHQTGVLGATGIGVHSYFDGFVIGQAFQAGEQMGFVVGSTIILHKLTDGISAVGIMMGTHQSLRSTTAMLAMVSVAPLIGVATQGFFVLPVPLLALLLTWFAGGFLYLGACSLLPAAHEGRQPQWLPLVTLLGSLFIYGIHLLAE